MDSKAFFRSVGEAREKLRLLQEERERYEQLATTLSGSMGETMIRSTDNHSRVESSAIRLAEITERIEAEADKYTQLLEQARSIIGEISTLRHRQVLTLRYLCGYSWTAIQERMGYSDKKSAFRVHGWALVAAQQVMDKYSSTFTQNVD